MESQSQEEQKRLLIVDDEPSILKLLKTLLARAGYQVATCAGANEALRLMSQSQFDLMITDAMMPLMTGFDLVRTIRHNPSFSQIPILMLTRKNERSDVQKALEAGVTDYVLKPIDNDLLIDKVELSLRNRAADKRLRELSIHGPESEGTANLQVRIISLRETGMVARFPLPIPPDAPFRIETPLFGQIGIAPPILKMTACELDPAKEVPSQTEFPYSAEFTFVGMNESDLRKIRAWLQKQEIQRRK